MCNVCSTNALETYFSCSGLHSFHTCSEFQTQRFASFHLWCSPRIREGVGVCPHVAAVLTGAHLYLHLCWVPCLDVLAVGPSCVRGCGWVSDSGAPRLLKWQMCRQTSKSPSAWHRRTMWFDLKLAVGHRTEDAVHVAVMVVEQKDRQARLDVVHI